MPSPTTAPDLTGRVARCGCGREVPSDSTPAPAFFEYLGPGSPHLGCGECGYREVAHHPDPLTRRRNVVAEGRCSGYVVHPGKDHDAFYCGCRGWD